MALQFLQLGDAHLGAALTGLPTDLAESLRAAARDAVKAAFSEVARREIQLVILPGDLFEQEGADPAAQLRFVYELAAGVAPIPVVITPGNHDAYGPKSPYATLEAPHNVVLFTRGELAAQQTPAGPVVGRAVQSGEASSALDWSQLPPPSPPGLLVLHAALLQATDDRRHRDSIVPVTLDALRRSGYSYVALGHYHRYQAWDGGQPGPAAGERAVAAYAGCPQGLGFDELGAKGYVVGRLEEDGANLEFVPAARHVFRREKLMLPPEYAARALASLDELLAGIRSGLGPQDILELEITGRWPQASRGELVSRIERLAATALHCRPLEWNRVEFTPPLVERGQSAVLDEFLDRCDKESAAPGADAAAWELARYLGHRLLSGRGLPGKVA